MVAPVRGRVRPWPGPVGYKRTMSFRSGLIVGVAVGYYLGARAGRERYEEIERTLDRVRATDAYQQARERVLDLIDGGMVQARTMIEDVVPDLRDTGPDAPLSVVSLDDERYLDDWPDTAAR